MDGIRIPETTEDKLKVRNLVKISLGLVIFSFLNVQRLFQVKLLIIESSAARALATPLRIEMLRMAFDSPDLNNLAPKTLTTKPKPPTIPNLRNF